MSTHLRGLGWKRSPLDPRDIPADTTGIKILAEVDPRHQYMTAVYDQGQLGSCTANTVAEAVDADRIVNGEPPLFPSRLAIYWEERHREGSSPLQDTGAYGRDGLWTARRIGLWLERDIPYTDDVHDRRFYSDPQTLHGPPKLKMERPYKSVPHTMDAVKAVLSNRQTLLFGFTVYSSFMTDEVALTGVVPMPDIRREQIEGGHEVLAVGYLKSEPHYALCRNHWGNGWGIGGYFLMPWAYLLDRSLTDDFRTIYRPAK